MLTFPCSRLSRGRNSRGRPMRIRCWMPSSMLVVALAAAPNGWAQKTDDVTQHDTTRRVGAPVFRAGTEAVLLDIIVRDRKGKPVSDLAAEEIEVFEDGLKQEVRSFRRIGASMPADAAGAGAGAGAVAPAADGPVRQVTMAFDRLSVDARRLAREAALEFVKTQMTPTTRVTVVSLSGGRVLPIEVGAADPEQARQAIRRAVGGLSARDSAQPVRSASDDGATLPTAGPDAAAVARVKARGIQGSMGDQTLAQSFDGDTLYGLGALVEEVRSAAGRKTLLFFSEGMIVPPGLDHVFRNVISAANRSNVSFYAIDVRGLGLASQLSAARSALEETSRISESQRTAGTSDNPLTRQHLGQDDLNLTSLSANTVSTLEELSTSTGGLLISETNSFSRGIARVGADLSEYYEVAYQPAAASDSGQFHKIDVRVARKGVRVRTRSGYFTSPLAAPGSLAPTVAAALTVLSRTTLPHDIEALCGVLRFGPTGNAVEHVLRVEVSLAGIALDEDKAAGRFRGHLTIFGQVKDAAGVVVDAFGQEYPMQGPLAEIERLHAASVTYSRRLRLAPGAYTLEWIARDAGAGRATAERRALTVGSPQERLSMSSLVVVGGIAPSGSGADPSDPLLIADSLISPNLGHAIVPSAGRDTLPLYCVVYYPASAQDTPTATIEVSRDGNVVARGGGPLARPDAQGRIQHLATISLRKLTPGDYLVRVTVSKDDLKVEESATMRIGS
jgi:VWFA-related protein